MNGPAGQTWTVTAVTGLYTMGSPAPPAGPIPILVGATMTEGPAGTYTLMGKHIDAIGYTITVNNGLGTSLSIGNTCEYPNPVITGLPAQVCAGSPVITLTGNPNDANIISQSFTVNGVAATQFNPSTPGSYTIGYTVDGGVPKAFSPTDPGCVQTVTQQVTVTPGVNGTISGANATICAGQAGTVGVNLAGTPNFNGRFSITTISGTGTNTPSFGWVATVNGPSSVNIPAGNLTNTSSNITIYRIAWEDATALRDANNCPIISPLTGFMDITVHPTPTLMATRVNAAGDICPGTLVQFNVSNPNLIPGSVFNWTAVGADASVLGGANNVAFGNNAVSTTLGLTCPVNAAINPITFTFTPVGPGPQNCFGAASTQQVNVRDVVAPNLTGVLPGGNLGNTCVANAPAPPTTTAIRLLYNDNCTAQASLAVTGPVTTTTGTCNWTRTYTYTISDACGNSTTANVIYTGNDTQAPTWTTTVGSLNTTIECTNNGIAFVAQLMAAQNMAPTATDNCATAGTLNTNRVKTAGVFAQSNPGTCTVAGTYTNTFVTNDGCGNSSAVFTQVITIVDNTPPTLSSPAPQTLDVGNSVNCQVALPDYRGLVTATDCSAVTLTQSPAIGTTIVGGPGPGPVGGSQIVTITATDACGNVSTRNITVNLYRQHAANSEMS